MADQSGNGKAGKKGPSGRSYRNATGLTRQPKKMRGRKVSSQRWLTRQLNDPFVAEAKSRGFRSRAALKLEQMDDRYHLLQPGMAIVDLGCAPGGFDQHGLNFGLRFLISDANCCMQKQSAPIDPA